MSVADGPKRILLPVAMLWITAKLAVMSELDVVIFGLSVDVLGLVADFRYWFRLRKSGLG